MDPFKRYKVYEIRVFDKPYIGYTSMNLLKRLREHMDQAHDPVGKKTRFCRALGNFEAEQKTIPSMYCRYDSDNQVHAMLMEVKLIRDLDTQCRGWNISPGGEGHNSHVKDLASVQDVEHIFGKDTSYFYKIFPNAKHKPLDSLKKLINTAPKPIIDPRPVRLFAHDMFSAYQFKTQDIANLYNNTTRRERKNIFRKFKRWGAIKKMDQYIEKFIKRRQL